MLLWTAWSAWVTAYMSFVRQCRRRMDPASKKRKALQVKRRTEWRASQKLSIMMDWAFGFSESHPSHASRSTWVWR
ncbi:hypothetical protein F5J12DRAFT_5998 [Pisolithus orientalis]|uniref:uncharacterized protein n=1 Tax=Pisolithus orientalis TaxID=936130 RepID=UPI00222443EF|nr:uncharacterized protein F5J12DRAFT_5998 [Pisolithus orientalis]KAI6034969.1 hypothetical protein F5J12DRAFT_5998 [Pisolithus orientalis]